MPISSTRRRIRKINSPLIVSDSSLTTPKGRGYKRRSLSFIIARTENKKIQRRRMMAIANFEDHCWKDIVTPEILETYKPYHRETYIGQRPALLAIDLYNLVYEGGPK